jgi:hypothetical protein
MKLDLLGLKSKIRKVSPQINKGSFLPESNWKMEEPFLTTIFKRNPLSIWSSDLEEVVVDPRRSNHPLLLLQEATDVTR